MKSIILLTPHLRGLIVNIEACEAMNFRLSFFIILPIIATVSTQTVLEVALYLRKHLSETSAVHLPSESNYTLETTQRWNAFSAPTYIISVKLTTDRNVEKIVRLFDSTKSEFSQI